MMHQEIDAPLVDTLRRLRDQLALLPQITVEFGGARHVVPPSLVRDKVLAVVESYITAAQITKSP